MRISCAILLIFLALRFFKDLLFCAPKTVYYHLAINPKWYGITYRISPALDRPGWTVSFRLGPYFGLGFSIFHHPIYYIIGKQMIGSYFLELKMKRVLNSIERIHFMKIQKYTQPF